MDVGSLGPLLDNWSLPVNLALLVIFLSILYYFKTKNTLPGPRGLPYFGFWPFWKPDTFHLELQKHQKKYGDLFSFTYAGNLFVNMGSVKALREVEIAKADCFDRLYSYNLFEEFFKDAVINISGETWKAQRKFIVQQFKELGMTAIKESSGAPLYQSVQETVDYLRSKKGEPVNMMSLIQEKCTDILRCTMFGESGITLEEIREFIEPYTLVTSFMDSFNMLYCGPMAKYLILPLKSGFRNSKTHQKTTVKVLKKILERRKLSLDLENPRDYIDAFYKEKNARESKEDPTAQYFTDDILLGSLRQFIGDGVSTVAGLVNIFLLFVLEHPEEQEKIYTEVMEVVGPGRAPSINDKSKMRYTNSLFLEVLRIANFFPVFPTQQCIKETTVRGYRIPKGAIILLNMYTCHKDPDMYPDPEKFDPSRFVAKEGKPRPELPVAFGVGRKSCPGEGYAMAQSFLFLTTLIKNFKITVVNNDTSDLYERLHSGNIEIRAHPRNQ